MYEQSTIQKQVNPLGLKRYTSISNIVWLESSKIVICSLKELVYRLLISKHNRSYDGERVVATAVDDQDNTSGTIVTKGGAKAYPMPLLLEL